MKFKDMKIIKNFLHCVVGFISLVAFSWLIFLAVNIFFAFTATFLAFFAMIFCYKKIMHYFFSNDSEEEFKTDSKTIETEYHVVNEKEE